jgi:hypothetical protein
MKKGAVVAEKRKLGWKKREKGPNKTTATKAWTSYNLRSSYGTQMTQLNQDPESLDLLRKDVDRLGQQLGGGAGLLLPLPPADVLLLLLVPHPTLLLLITDH